MDRDERTRRLAEKADAYARVALENIQREFPVSAPYYLTEPGPLPTPRERHPAFYGSFDWHSSVEMHWVPVRLLRLFPDLPVARAAREILDRHLTADNLATEAAYFERHRGFERPYGWAWLLTLAHELATWDDGDARRWSANMTPLGDMIRDGFLTWLPKATYPQRMGMHGNSAFALLRALDYARDRDRAGDPSLLCAIGDAADRWYTNDTGYVASFEPSGSDFLSPALTEAAFVAQTLVPDGFAAWLTLFVVSLDPLLTPAVVSDPSDGQIAHLHGLNLSRAYCMRLIIEGLPAGDPRVAALEASIDRHIAVSLDATLGGDYMVAHWLPAFALLLLS